MDSFRLFDTANLASNHLPTITIGMLRDFLSGYDILSFPGESRRIVRWFETDEQYGAKSQQNLRSGQILRICRIADAQRMLSHDENAFVLALSPDGSLPLWTERFKNRLIVARQRDTFSYFLFLVQRFFSDVMMWEHELDLIIAKKGSLHDLLNVGNFVLRDHIACLDATGTMLAFTENVALPENEDAARIEHTITIEGLPFAVLRLTSPSPTVSSGTRDLFNSLVTRVESLCDLLWREQVRIDSPHHFFFTGLIEGKRLDCDEIESGLVRAGIPRPAQFKLVLVDMGSAPESISLAQAAQQANLINHGDCFCIVHGGCLCVICYAAEGDNQLSHEKTVSDVTRLLYEPFCITCTSSQIFEDISDLDLAYRQAVIAKNLRDIVEKEASNASAFENGITRLSCKEGGAEPLIPFENCLIYYLVGAAEKDERFLSFAFSHTLMQKISAEDRENGTNYLEVFWHFLTCERNATMVAERLHMHRNTVLYRIDKIQKRFDLDLSRQDVREKMIIDFKVFFLMQNHSSIRKLFESDARTDAF